jgi:hypothetical protein
LSPCSRAGDPRPPCRERHPGGRRRHELFRWCLQAGLRVLKLMTYMAIGEHRERRGAWIPSVLY